MGHLQQGHGHQQGQWDQQDQQDPEEKIVCYILREAKAGGCRMGLPLS